MVSNNVPSTKVLAVDIPADNQYVLWVVAEKSNNQYATQLYNVDHFTLQLGQGKK